MKIIFQRDALSTFAAYSHRHPLKRLKQNTNRNQGKWAVGLQTEVVGFELHM